MNLLRSMMHLSALAILLLTGMVHAQGGQLLPRLEAYFNALNANDVTALFAFYEDGATQSFRDRRDPQQDRELYAKLTADLGRLEIQDIMRDADDEVVVVAYSDTLGGPVTFTFAVRDERIDGVGVRLGDAGPAEPALPLEVPDNATEAELVEALDGQLAQFAGQDAFSGVLLIARDGVPFFHKAYGPANRARGIPNTTATAFDIGSITKLITRVAVGQLLQSGKLSLDGRIIDYLPDYPDKPVAEQVTVAQLLAHRSGLGDIFNDRWHQADKTAFVEPRDFFSLFAGEPLRFTPGEGSSYSNAGYVVLGAIVAAASGQRYADYVSERIFAPAGMTRSGFVLRDGSDPSLAIGYTRDRTDEPLQDNLDSLPVRGCPAGSTMHTAHDLLKFDVALRGGKLLDARWTAWAYGSDTVREHADYGIAIAGGAPGVSAGFGSDGRITVVSLSNIDPPAGEFVMDAVFGALTRQ